jgi:glycosyltransferase involved in cell wall biosynthesis
MYSDKNEVIAIPNGVKIPEPVMSQDILEAFSLEKKKYFLMVSRFVPEKRQDDLIEAFLASSASNNRKLVLVGDYTNGEEEYLKKVCELAQAHPNVVLTGFQTGDALAALYTNAESFFLPSSHEGLPIALLEALSYGLYVVVSDIPAHLEMELDTQYYFKLGDRRQLTQHMENIPCGGLSVDESIELVQAIREKFDWSVIAKQTFKALLNGK